MVYKIIFLIIFIALSVWMMSLSVKTVPTRTNVLVDLGLWILGLYIGLIIGLFIH